MGYRYHLDPERYFALITATGRVTGADIVQSLAQMTSDPDWRYGMRQVNDFRRITEFIITKEDLQAITALEQQRETEGRSGDGKLAIVVTDEMYEVACALYAKQAKPRKHEVKVFRSMEEAMRWIEEEPGPYAAS